MKLVAGRLTSVRRPMACATVFVLVQLVSGCSSDSPQPIAPIGGTAAAAVASGDGTVLIRSRLAPGKCLTVQGGRGNLEGSTPTELRSCAGGADQQFAPTADGEFRFHTDFCVDAATGLGRPGDAVNIFPCHGGRNQKWSLTSAGEIRGINGLCVDVRGADPSDGQRIIVYTCHGGSNQLWDIDSSATDGTTRSKPVATVAVELGSAALAVGQTAQATAVLKDAAGNVLTGRAVTWASSAPAVASVSASGLVAALAAGSATITAASEGMSAGAALTVTAPVTSPPSGGASCGVTDWTPRPKSALAKPGYLQTVAEPDFGTTITRITGDPGTPIGNGVAGNWPAVAYHNYPKDPVWTADQALLVLKTMSGVPSPGAALFLDGSTYRVLFSRTGPAGGGEWRLHPTLPDVAVYLNANGSVGHWNVRTNVSTLKFSAPAGAYSGANLSWPEANVSYDGRWVTVQATRNSDGRKVAYTVDIGAGTKGADIDLAAFGVGAVDWVSVSPLGTYVVVSAVIDGAGYRVKAWDRATGRQVQYWTTHPLGHADIGIDQAGREVVFGGANGSVNAKQFVTLDLASGAVAVQSPPTSYNWHASTRSNLRRGWGYAVTNDYTGTALDGEIYALKLDGSRGIERYGRYHGVNSRYDDAPKAVPSPDGKRLLFASNWGSTTGPIQAYVLDLRPRCP